MRGAHHEAVLREIGQAFRGGTVSGLSEDELLQRLLAHGDESAFEAIVLRHGPMVWGVCRRLLRDPHDAEDAFQATLLILLRKGGALRDPSGISPWLYGVAHRVALRARANATRRREQERGAAKSEAIASDGDSDLDRLRLVLDEEIRRLPEKYLRPVVLCYLEGLTYQEAADRLNRTPATIKGRLARARERLRSRLTRRGLGSVLGLVGIDSFSETASAAVPPALVDATTKLLRHTSTLGSISKVTASATIMTLVDGVINAMRVSRIKVATLALMVITATTLITLACAFAQNSSENPGAIAGRPKTSAHPDEIKAPVSSDPAKTGQPGRTLEIRVIDKRSGRAIPEVPLKIAVESQKREVTTDSSGRYLLTLPEAEPDSFWIHANKEGFVPTWVGWSNLVDSIRFSLPKAVDLPLEPGTKIGGLIQDPTGRPIEGALVYLLTSGSFDLNGGIARPSLTNYPIKTDAEGRWVCNFVPANFDRLWFRLKHPDYVSDTSVSREGPRTSALRDLSSVMVMEPGVPVSGKVVDRDDRPIAAATVMQGILPQGIETPLTKTDGQGHFSFPHVAPGDLVLTARASGHARELRQVRVKAGMSPVEFHLDPGRDVRGRVVDQAGKPLADASVDVREWPKYQYFWSRTKTDTDGRFLLTDEPADALTLRIHKPGFLSSDQPVPADAGEQLITLTPELRIRGSVVDAETGRPIDAFTLLIGDETKDELHRWNRDLAYHRHDGRYEAVLVMPKPEVRSLRVEADGYLPAVSREFRSTEGLQTYDFKLTRGSLPADPALSGIIRLPDGSPAEGATVTLATKSYPVYLKDGRDENPQRHPTLKTGPEGRFAFPRQTDPAMILVEHEQGYARLPQEDLDSSHVVTLRPWGRVEGILKIGTQPGTFQMLRLSSGPMLRQRDPRVNVRDDEAETDASGRFIFKRIISGEARIARLTKIRPGSQGMGPWVPFDVKPGATVHVEVGGTGRPVVGRVANMTGVDGSPVPVNIQLNLKLPKFEAPQGLTREQRAEWAKAWRQTPAGKAFFQECERAMHASYPVKVEPDGSFRIENVTAGTYEWRAYATGSAESNRQSWSVTPNTIIVPEIPGGRSDKPLGIGELELVAKERTGQ